MDQKTKEVVQKSIIHNFDDGEIIFLDWNKITENELNEIVLSYFDVVNIPKECYDNISNYYITFISSVKSSTGYIGMFVNKNRDVFRKNNYLRSDFK